MSRHENQPKRIRLKSRGVKIGLGVAGGTILATAWATGALDTFTGNNGNNHTTSPEHKLTIISGSPTIDGKQIIIGETPTATPTATKTPEATPTPKRAENLQDAIAKGEIKLNGEKDWEKFFIAITPAEASKLLAAADAGVTTVEDYKVLLPFDPTTSPELTISEVKPFTGAAAYAKDIAIAFDNVHSARFTSPIDGTSTELENGYGPDRVPNYLGAQRNGGYLVTIQVAQVNASPKIPDGKSGGKSVGSAMFEITDNKDSGFVGAADKEAVMAMGLNGFATKMRISNFLTVTGPDGQPRIAFISQN